MGVASDRVGLWVIGAGGAVSSTVALGIAALQRRLVPTTGMVSTLPVFERVGLPDVESIVFGGHELRAATLLEGVRELHDSSGVIAPEVIEACRPALRAIQRQIRPGTLRGRPLTASRRRRAVPTEEQRRDIPDDPTAEHAVERLASDIDGFRRRHRLDRVIAVHLASTEPRCPATAHRLDAASLTRALRRRGGDTIPTSVLYALAAIRAGCAYVNFTPSTGIALPVAREIADEAGLPYMGSDGKTGETLVKSFLAPLFALRNLRVLSWCGQNILGNRDGAALLDPAARETKVRSKERTVSSILGGNTATRVGIDHVASLGDWKVAWDFVHFTGFLDTRMHLQFTWHGCDSLLAAPLVIDLARFAALALRQGERGPMRHLACFFKDPMDVPACDYPAQWRALVEYAGGGS